jgi:ribosome biogenesis GTPase
MSSNWRLPAIIHIIVHCVRAGRNSCHGAFFVYFSGPKPILNNKISLVIGPSGSGKSSLLNLMVPHAHASVAEVSHALQSGRHTTTSTTLYWLDSQRQSGLIDSPGFQEFGLQQIQPAELAGLMLDIRSFLGGCRFYNCTHRHEPHCSVNQAYQDGKISQNRLDIYRSIYDEISTQKW